MFLDSFLAHTLFWHFALSRDADFSFMIGSIIAMLLMDKLGRKVLLLWSFFGMVNSSLTDLVIEIPFMYN